MCAAKDVEYDGVGGSSEQQGELISTVDDVQYFRGISLVLWRDAIGIVEGCRRYWILSVVRMGIICIMEEYHQCCGEAASVL